MSPSRLLSLLRALGDIDAISCLEAALHMKTEGEDFHVSIFALI